MHSRTFMNMLSPQSDTLGQACFLKHFYGSAEASLSLCLATQHFRCNSKCICHAFGSLQTVALFGNKRAHTESHKHRKKWKNIMQVLNLLSTNNKTITVPLWLVEQTTDLKYPTKLQHFKSKSVKSRVNCLLFTKFLSSFLQEFILIFFLAA